MPLLSQESRDASARDGATYWMRMWSEETIYNGEWASAMSVINCNDV